MNKEIKELIAGYTKELEVIEKKYSDSKNAKAEELKQELFYRQHGEMSTVAPKYDPKLLEVLRKAADSIQNSKDVDHNE